MVPYTTYDEMTGRIVSRGFATPDQLDSQSSAGVGVVAGFAAPNDGSHEIALSDPARPSPRRLRPSETEVAWKPMAPGERERLRRRIKAPVVIEDFADARPG